MPKFSCKFTEDIVDPDEVCTAENICADDPRIEDSWTDWDSRNSLHNWYESLDLKCADSWQVSGISFANFIGCLITLPWAPKLGDVLGRKKILTWFNLVQFLSFTVIMFNKNLWVMTAASGVFGATNSIVASNGFLYMLELVPQKSKTRVATIFFMLDQTSFDIPLGVKSMAFMLQISSSLFNSCCTEYFSRKTASKFSLYYDVIKRVEL